MILYNTELTVLLKIFYFMSGVYRKIQRVIHSLPLISGNGKLEIYNTDIRYTFNNLTRVILFDRLNNFNFYFVN